MATAGIDYANWDLTDFFPEWPGLAYAEFKAKCEADLAEHAESARSLGPLAEENAPAWARFVLADEKLEPRLSHMLCYVQARSACDVRDEALQAEMGSLSMLWAEYEKVRARFNAALKGAGDAAFAKLLAQPGIEGAEHALSRLREAARLTMGADLEELAADLGVTGFAAWERLQEKISGALEFDLKRPDGSAERVPISRKLSLMQSPDPAIRKAAHDGANEAWAKVEDSMAAALNGIAGTRLALHKRRGVGHFLDPSLFDAKMTRATLDALNGAIAKGRGLPRRYLKLKAKLHGAERLGFHDLQAPLPLKGGRQPLRWDQAKAKIERSFGASYPKLAEFARMAFEKNWIESEIRAGKAAGGFCTSSTLNEQSRIFMTYAGERIDAQILAHELGHAFHNELMRGLRPLACGFSLSLCETASIFAETLYTGAILDDPEASPEEKAATLDTRAKESASCLLNIPARFAFEKAFHEERAKGEVPVSRLKELSIEALREAYGDALAEDSLDPYFWTKGHLYCTDVSFYNYPYSFGYLLSLGMFARFEEEGPAFLPRYEEFLRLTGSFDAQELAKNCIGADLESEEFWLGSIALIEKDIERFEAEVPGVVGAAF